MKRFLPILSLFLMFSANAQVDIFEVDEEINEVSEVSEVQATDEHVEEEKSEKECHCGYKELTLSYLSQDLECGLSCEELGQKYQLELLKGEVDVEEVDGENTLSCLAEIGVVSLNNFEDESLADNICLHFEAEAFE